MKLETIIESYKDGQFKQFREQVKRYGKKRFMVDTYQHECLPQSEKLDLIYYIATRG